MGLTVPVTGLCGSGWGKGESSGGIFRGDCLGRLCKVIISVFWEDEKVKDRPGDILAVVLAVFQPVASELLRMWKPFPSGEQCGLQVPGQCWGTGGTLPKYPSNHLGCLQCQGTTSWKTNFSALPPVFFSSFLKCHILKAWAQTVQEVQFLLRIHYAVIIFS